MDATDDAGGTPSGPVVEEPAAADRGAVRRRSLVVGTVAAVAAVAAATAVALVAAERADEPVALPEPDAEIRFLPEDDETGQPLLGDDRTGELAPDDPYPLLDGGLGTFADLRGTPVVVNFFASWCAPCKAELPDFAAVDAELGDRVTFIGVNVRDREADARTLLAETGVDFAVARDPSGALSEAFGVINMPSTFFLDAEGRIVSSRPGALSADELRDEIAELGLMLDVPFAYAFTLGMVATINPCGFPMLPAYLSFFIGADGDDADGGVPRALLAAASVSFGFLLVFSVLSVPLDAGVTAIYRVMPWLTIVVGIALVATGVAMLLGHKPTLALPRLDRGGRDRGVASMVLFGVSYAIASLSCTVPLFLSVIANRTGAASSALTVVAYGLGMSAVLTALTLALALARASIVHRVRSLLPHVQRASGALLVAVGLYLVYYWVFNLARDPSDTVGSNPVDGLEALRVEAARLLLRAGGRVGVAVAVVAVVALVWTSRRRRRLGAGASVGDAGRPLVPR